MRLDEFIEDFEFDDGKEAERRRLAEEKSYAIVDHLDIADRFDGLGRGDPLVGSRSPSVFVGQGSYPYVTTGILAPVGDENAADRYATDGEWYRRGLSIDSVLQRRTGLLNSRRAAEVDVHDVWDGFVGTQREVAMADDPVDVEIGLHEEPNADILLDDIASPTGPGAEAGSAKLTENPSIPKPVKKTLEDDDWKAEGAMWYLYEKGLDVYGINQILSTGTLGEADNRRLVPTRWSITAVDDAIGKHLRREIRNNQELGETRVYCNEYMGNRYWVVLSPGRWEFELVEVKREGSVWNPSASGAHLSSAYEGPNGRRGYVEETAGAYYATRLGVLEHLRRTGRRGRCLVIREVSPDYWAPVGVWQIRESVRNAFDGEAGVAESFHQATRAVTEEVGGVGWNRLRRKSEMAAGVQSTLDKFL